MSENETHEQEEISIRLFTSAEGHRCSKSTCSEQRTLPYLSLMQVIYLSPSHWSGQGAHSSWLANWKKLLLQKEVKRKGVSGGSSAKTRAKWSNKISFDRKDIMLLSTISPFHFFNQIFFSSNSLIMVHISCSIVSIRSILAWWGGCPSCFVRAVSINLWISPLAQGITQHATKTRTLFTAIWGVKIEAISPFYLFLNQFFKRSVKGSLIPEFSESSSAKVINSLRALVMVLSGTVLLEMNVELDINHYTDSTLFC